MDKEQLFNNIYELVYDNLTVADFIITANYFSFLYKTFWINSYEEISQRSSYSIEIEKVDDKKIKLLTCESDIFSKEIYSFYKFNINDLANIINKMNDDYILSIDYDFFSSNDVAAETITLEITSNEYENYLNNYYHQARLMLGSKFHVFQTEGKYYCQFNLYDGKAKSLENDTKVKLKLEQFEIQIQKIAKKPALIILCASLKSGFLNKEHYEFIDNKIKKILGEYMGVIEYDYI